MSNGTSAASCEDLLAREVKPGDLIEARLITCLLKKVLDLESRIGEGDVGQRTVPNVFGLTLAQAQTILALPTVGLTLGKTLDPQGLAVNRQLAASATRIVIGQTPDAGKRVAAGATVDVLLSGVAGPANDPSQGGDAATGFIEVQYQNSPRGTNVVPGDDEGFSHLFMVRNDTNRQLTIQLSALVTAPSGNWSESAQILNAEGQPISSVTLPPSTGGTAATQQVRVVVFPPGNAEEGETAVLTLSANVPAPHNKTDTATLNLLVSDEEGEPVTRTVTFEQFLGPANTSNLNTGQILSFTCDFLYQAEEAPFTGSFDVVVEVNASGGPVSEWSVLFTGGLATANPSPGVYQLQTPLTLTSGAAAATRVTLQIRAPQTRSATGPKVGTVTFTIRSTNLPEPISAQQPPITLTLAALPS